MPIKPIKRPSLFKDTKTIERKMKAVGDALVSGTLDAGMEAVKELPPDVNIDVKRMPKYLQVTQKRMNKLGVIDLKPYFARSGKRVIKPDGGWYLRVPIKRPARKLSRRAYEQLRAIDIRPNERKTVISDYLYDYRRQSDATMLNYKPKSKTIEKRRVGKNRHTYTAYRTVSDKSPPNSWIVNRRLITREKGASETFIKNVDRLMKWKMKNGWN